jgi:hypothetical protein
MCTCVHVLCAHTCCCRGDTSSHYVAQAGLKLVILLPQASLVLGLQMCGTMPRYVEQNFDPFRFCFVSTLFFMLHAQNYLLK